MSIKIRTKQISGVGLIEALIALLVITVGIVGGIRIQTTVLESYCSTQASSIASSVLQSELDKIRGLTSSAGCPISLSINANVGGNAYTGTLTRISTDSYSCTYNASIETNHCKADATSPLGFEYSNIRLLVNNSSLWAASGGSGVNIPSPVIAERLSDTTGISNPAGAFAGTAVKEEDGHYVLYAQNPNNLGDSQYYGQIKSNVPFVKISGVVFSYKSGGTATSISSLRSSNSLNVISSGVGYCQFPLKYGNANDPSTYTLNSLPANTTSAGYLCYVPEGWYGNIGLDFSDNTKKLYGCPDSAPDNSELIGGVRSHKVIFSSPSPPSAESDITGQSGINQSHEASGKLSALHFVIFESNSKDSCPDVIRNYNTRTRVNDGISFQSHSIPPTSAVLTSQGYGGIKQTVANPTPAIAGLTGSACKSSGNCLKARDYWVDTVGASNRVGTLLRESGSAFNWGDVNIIMTRTSVYGGVVSSECSVTVPADQQASSTSFQCLVGNTEEVTLSSPASTNITIVAPAQLTFSPLPDALTLTLSGTGP